MTKSNLFLRLQHPICRPARRWQGCRRIIRAITEEPARIGERRFGGTFFTDYTLTGQFAVFRY